MHKFDILEIGFCVIFAPKITDNDEQNFYDDQTGRN
jgi:hypothetical protein